MKKLILIFAIGITAVTHSQPLDGYKFCIDPGHGGHDAANDRHIVEADFWESEGNFGKALHVEEILTSFGAEVILTRYGNNDSDDIALSARAAIANQNNVDFFQSIHSNATGTSTRRNFVLMLYRGYDNGPVFPEAKDYSRIVYRNLEKNNHVEDLGYDNIRGDWSFYPAWGTSGLGVLRPLTLPGVLSEGSFHDYLPEAWRLKNDDYLRHDAWAIVRSIMDYFNAGEPETGIIAGIVRDPDKTVPSSYKAISSLNDSKKPVNYIRVRLEPGGRIYEGDNQNNGYYMFDNLEPGNYKIYFETEYYEQDSADVSLSANQSVFVHKELSEMPDYSNPNILSIFPEDNTVDFSTRDTVEVLFDQRMDRSSTEQAFTISPSVSGKLFWRELDKKLMFFPTVPFDQETQYSVTVSTSAKTVYESNLQQEFNSSFTTGTASNSNVISGHPEDGAEGVSNRPEIVITFDTRMNTITTQNAFSISPDIDGSFKWSEGTDTLHYITSSPGVPGETYTVAIDQSARNYYGGFLENEYSFSFTTRSKLNLIDNYPFENDVDVSTTVLVKLEFDMPIQSSSLPGNILFYDENDNFIQVSVNQAAYAKGFIEFEPSQPLDLGATYRVILKEGIADIEGVTLGEEITVPFTTENSTWEDGNILDDFENAESWIDPVLSQNTMGIDEELTEFTLTGTRYTSELNSGKIAYTFTGSNGLIELEHQSHLEVGGLVATIFSVWVFGDYSGNILEFWFEDSQSNQIITEIDTIDWTGWMIKSVGLNELGGAVPYKLNSIVIRQAEHGNAEGVVYFDDAQVDDFFTDVKDTESGMPDQFALQQNYPNPFNPSTVIEYSIPAVYGGQGESLQNVTLIVYDVLGREVATLVNRQQKPGYYRVEFDASSLSSGMYLYKVTAGSFISSKKMLLLK